MGISSAMYSGVSGLNTNSQAMSVIGNNLANTNTVGFKGSRTVFADLLSGSINGSGGMSQVGRGVGMSKVDQIFSQGTFETTESNLDVAVEGDGFFVLKEAGDATAYYSRAGSFRFNEDGYLVNPEGLMVQGKSFDANGTLKTGDAGNIQVASSGLVAGNVTSTLELTTNLDSTEPIIYLDPLDPSDPAYVGPSFAYNDSTTYNYSSSVQVFDTLGNPHLLSTYFTKTADNTWESFWSAEKDDGSGAIMSGSLGTLNFTPDGVLSAATTYTIPPGTAAGELSWGNSTTNTGIAVTFDTTQFNSESVVISQNQNGTGAGNLTGVEINSEGIVVASYSNGEQTKIAQLILGKFVNTSGLSLAGSNLYTATTSSGPARTGLPGPELGNIFTNSLEQSNVDMGSEFVRMITVQRGFQANSKIITTVDELLGELINLKR
ncbi:flagellar hook protein FlgE [Desulfopila sp. IMCC35006]|uniref:flagellar hook protein FlgE n=1 Tax=Desulfopila sp. IMCC35006 TaxID=2569542 RepID=UPI0010ABF860|nr:flagellar hook protein FlgE [Desulfopila sp. IMCC35006]TKB25799.1 flagellar hook protein FlgE [Desulfopila sp. IMCC35006]